MKREISASIRLCKALYRRSDTVLNAAGKKIQFFLRQGFTVKKTLRIVRAIDDALALPILPRW